MQDILPEAKKLPSDLNRCYCDDKINASGRNLLKNCNNDNLRIGNGQTFGDRLGNYTCFNYEGASVVDYHIVEESTYEKIFNFRVLPPTFDSKQHLLNPLKTYKWDSQNFFPKFK